MAKESEIDTPLDFIRQCRETHVEWIDFLESGKKYQPELEHVGGVEHHKWCVEWHDKVIEWMISKD